MITLCSIMHNLIMTWEFDLKHAERTFTTLEMKNYHFAPKGDMLDLTFKNYYGAVLTLISLLRNLFHDLMTNYTWFNYVLSKVTKLWKLVTWATIDNIQSWKYWYEAHNGSFDTLPLPVLNNDRWRRDQRSSSWFDRNNFKLDNATVLR